MGHITLRKNDAETAVVQKLTGERTASSAITGFQSAQTALYNFGG